MNLDAHDRIIDCSHQAEAALQIVNDLQAHLSGIAPGTVGPLRECVRALVFLELSLLEAAVGTLLRPAGANVIGFPNAREVAE